jgi:hypothetical protein
VRRIERTEGERQSLSILPLPPPHYLSSLIPLHPFPHYLSPSFFSILLITTSPSFSPFSSLAVSLLPLSHPPHYRSPSFLSRGSEEVDGEE